MENKKILRSTVIGFVLLLIALVLTGICGVTSIIDGGTGVINGQEVSYGFMNSIKNYFNMWRPALFSHGTAFVGLVLMFVAATSSLVLIILAIAKKKPVCILSALFWGASVAFLPFILILAIPMAQLGVVSGSSDSNVVQLFGAHLLYHLLNSGFKGLALHRTDLQRQPRTAERLGRCCL